MIRTTMPWLDKHIDRLKATNSLPREATDELIKVIELLEAKIRGLSMAKESCVRCQAKEILAWLRTRGNGEAKH